MKVRHRSNGYRDWKVLEESSTYYIAEGDYAPLALKKLECEPVQEWVDVTNQCHLEWTGGRTFELYHNGHCVDEAKGYRVTRHCLKDIKVERKKA